MKLSLEEWDQVLSFDNFLFSLPIGRFSHHGISSLIDSMRRPTGVLIDDLAKHAASTS